MRILIIGMTLLIAVVATRGLVQAQETTFTVNSTTDVDDGTCDATHCSLREAINTANANSGTDIIAFDIPGAGSHTIQPTSSLPTITDPVVIDGYTQTGASPNSNGPGVGSNAMLKIELDGTNAGAGAMGLAIEAGSSTVRGLVINRFDGLGSIGILLQSNGGNVIEGNFVGTSLSGQLAFGNSLGLMINGVSNNTVGGLSSEARNVISGNQGNGVYIINKSAMGNLVQGNFIGTDVTGTVDLGNGLFGVEIFDAPGNTIGGTAAEARNLISGNDAGGVTIQGGTLGVGDPEGNVVWGNFIGTDVTGANALGNTGNGVVVRLGANNTSIGGTTAGAGNVISGNGSDGVSVESVTSSAFLSNSIFSNGGLGIDLGNDGITSNDVGDGDTGPNNLQNFPIITTAEIDASGDLSVQYHVDSATRLRQ